VADEDTYFDIAVALSTVAVGPRYRDIGHPYHTVDTVAVFVVLFAVFVVLFVISVVLFVISVVLVAVSVVLFPVSVGASFARHLGRGLRFRAELTFFTLQSSGEPPNLTIWMEGGVVVSIDT
jgi:uncharacterized membrane protein